MFAADYCMYTEFAPASPCILSHVQYILVSICQTSSYKVRDAFSLLMVYNRNNVTARKTHAVIVIQSDVEMLFTESLNFCKYHKRQSRAWQIWSGVSLAAFRQPSVKGSYARDCLKTTKKDLFPSWMSYVNYKRTDFHILIVYLVPDVVILNLKLKKKHLF